jgi:3-oxoacyl-[acyl-carrier protein] reductase
MSESYRAPAQIHESVVAVTGAANGIGRAVAQRLVVSGARVAMCDLDPAVIGVADHLGPAAVAHVADLTETETADELCETALTRFGRLDGLVNCVGITGTTGVRSYEVDVEDFKRVLTVNLLTAFVLSKALLPHLVQQRYGRVLHVASIAGKEGNAGMVSYSASKAALIGMVKTQGKELAADGVTVNALAPAVIRTALVDRMPAEQVSYMTERIPMGRTGTLDEATAMVEFAVSPAASFTTGFTFDLSGGRATY